MKEEKFLKKDSQRKPRKQQRHLRILTPQKPTPEFMRAHLVDNPPELAQSNTLVEARCQPEECQEGIREERHQRAQS